MSTLVTRAGKGSPLTHNEVDANFTNLNTDKIQSGSTVAALTITALTTPSVQASGSGGLALKNSAGTTQISMGAGGGDNVTVSAPIAITPVNGLVNIAPTGTGSLTINPATAGTINNMSIGATTASTGKFSDLTDTGLTSGRVVYATTGGNLTDSANLTFNGTTLTTNTLNLTNALATSQGGTGNTNGQAALVANALTAGTGLTATATYNGSAAITFNATGTTINSQTSAYVLVAADAGKTVSITTGGVTVNNSVMSAGNIVSIYNNSGSSQTITQGTGVTLQWAGQSSSSTGNRTLGLYGLATILYISASNAVITGSGLT